MVQDMHFYQKDAVNSPKRIPYGISDYARMRQENAYYVDKTRYIPMIEAAPFYLFCIRPRRFGKSLWLSVLRHYYDVNQAENFEFLFGDTYIGQHSTPERNSYLVLFLNFSMVNPELTEVQQSFEENGGDEIDSFLRRYQRFFTSSEIEHIQSADRLETKLRRIFYYATEKSLKIYFFIDEYDNFTNTILSTEGQKSYYEITRGAGFYRHFFNLLKGATGGQITGLARLFITGVSPVTMDDVTSGFNIGTNISLNNRFNEMIGFTEHEVSTMLTAYHKVGWLQLPISSTLALMNAWYNHYCFGEEVREPMFNSDMVLYFLNEAERRTKLPLRLIDTNIRTDYNKLRHLMLIDSRLNIPKSERQLNGNFSELKRIIETGEAISFVNASFSLEQLTNPENFISLLYYFGLLSFAGTAEGLPRLQIPNRTVKDLMYEYLRSAFVDTDIFRLNMRKLANLMGNMAYHGEWRPFFDYINDEIRQQASVRDHLNGEKVLQGFLIAYLNVTHHFFTWSEKEMGGGFVDLYLEPFVARYPDMNYGYLIELKYISEKQFLGEGGQEKFDKKVAEAESQLKQYANDSRLEQYRETITFKQVALVYKGWELAYAEEVDTQREISAG